MSWRELVFLIGVGAGAVCWLGGLGHAQNLALRAAALTVSAHNDAALVAVRDALARQRAGYCSDAVMWQRLLTAEQELAR